MGSRDDLNNELANKVSQLEQFTRMDRRFKMDVEYIRENSTVVDPSKDLVIESNCNNINIVADTSKNINLYGKTVVHSGFTITGDSVIDMVNDTSFGANVDISQSLLVEGDISLNNNFSIGGDASFSSGVDISNDLNVKGDVSFNSKLIVNDDTSLNNNVDIGNKLTVGDDSSFNNSVDISNKLIVNGDASFNNKFSVGGDASFSSSVDISNNLNIKGDASFNQNLYLGGEIYNYNKQHNFGDASFNADVLISQNLLVKGDVSINSSLDISNNLYVKNDLSVNKNLNLGNNLNVDGDVSFNKNLDITQNLVLNGDASFNSSMKLSNKLQVFGDASFNSSLDISNNLYVKNDLSVNNNTYITNKLKVDGDVSFNKNLHVSDNVKAHQFIIGSAIINEPDLEQIDDITPGLVDPFKAVVVDGLKDISGFTTITTQYLNIGLASINETDLEQLDDITPGLVDPSKAIVVDGNKDISGFGTITADALIIGTVSISESTSNFIAGVTPGIADPSKAIVLNGSKDISGVNNITSDGTIQANELVINNDASFNNNVNIVNQLNVYNGDVSLNQNLLVGDDATFYSDLLVEKNLKVTGDVSFNSSLDVSENLFVKNDLSVNNITNLGKNLIMHGDASFINNVDICGNLNVNKLNVHNDTSFNQNVDIQKNLNVLDDASFNKNVHIFNNLNIDGDTDISGKLIVDSDASFNSKVDISDKFTVHSDSSFIGAVDILGTFNIFKLVVSGDVSYGASIDISSRLVVNEDVSFGSKITVGSDASFGGSLDISGNFYGTGDMSINGGFSSKRIRAETANRYRIIVGEDAGLTDQGDYSIAIGYQAGKTLQNNESIAIGRLAATQNQNLYAISIGNRAGEIDQSKNAIAIGYQAGRETQIKEAVAIGYQAGTTQQSECAIGIGTRAGRTNQGDTAIAIGKYAGENTQYFNAIAIGSLTGLIEQSNNAIAIGTNAGQNKQGNYSIAIGYSAGKANQHEKTIILNANTTALNSDVSNALFISPIRNNINYSVIQYNTTTKEITESRYIDILHIKSNDASFTNAIINNVDICNGNITIKDNNILDITDANLLLRDKCISGNKIHGGKIEIIEIDDITINSGIINNVTISNSDIYMDGKTIDLSGSNLILEDKCISGNKIYDGVIEQVTINKITGTMDFSDNILQNVNISGGTLINLTIEPGDTVVPAGTKFDVSAANFLLGDNQISGDKINGGTIDAITIDQLAGPMDCSFKLMTNVNISGGTIKGDITVGAGITLDLTAGSVLFADDQISGDKINDGTIDQITIEKLTGAMDCNNMDFTNINITSGFITGVSMDGVITVSKLHGPMNCNHQAMTNVNIDSGSITNITEFSSDSYSGDGIIDNFTGQTIFSDKLATVGAIISYVTFGGGSAATGDMSFSNVDLSGLLSVNDISLSGHIIPTADSSYDLGSADYKFRDLYLSSGTLYMAKPGPNTPIDVLSISGNVPIFKGTVIAPNDVSSNAIIDALDVSGNTHFNNPNTTFVVEPDVSFNQNMDVSGDVKAYRFIGDGSQLVGIDSFPTQTGNPNKLLTTDGSDTLWTSDISITNLDVSNNVNIQNNLTVNNDATIQNNLTVKNNFDASNIIAHDVSFVNLNVTNELKANKFIGDGSQLTGIDTLTPQTGHEGKILTTDGSADFWTSDISLSNIELSMNLIVKQNVSINNNLDVSADITATKLHADLSAVNANIQNLVINNKYTLPINEPSNNGQELRYNGSALEWSSQNQTDISINTTKLIATDASLVDLSSNVANIKDGLQNDLVATDLSIVNLRTDISHVIDTSDAHYLLINKNTDKLTATDASLVDLSSNVANLKSSLETGLVATDLSIVNLRTDISHVIDTSDAHYILIKKNTDKLIATDASLVDLSANVSAIKNSSEATDLSIVNLRTDISHIIDTSDAHYILINKNRDKLTATDASLVDLSANVSAIKNGSEATDLSIVNMRIDISVSNVADISRADISYLVINNSYIFPTLKGASGEILQVQNDGQVIWTNINSAITDLSLTSLTLTELDVSNVTVNNNLTVTNNLDVSNIIAHDVSFVNSNVTGTSRANEFIGDGSKLTGIETIPDITNNFNKLLITNGTITSWEYDVSLNSIYLIDNIQVGIIYSNNEFGDKSYIDMQPTDINIICPNVNISGNLFISNNNNNIITLDASDGYIKAAYDTNVTSYFGRAAIGYNGTDDLATIAHIDKNTTTDFALAQQNDGATILNTSTGQNISFRVNNTEKSVLTSDGKFGIGITDPSALLHVAGDVSFNANLDVSGNIKGTIITPAQPHITSIGALDSLTISGSLNGPATFIIDPAAIGDNTGLVIIKGSLQVDGSSTVINSSVLDISDHTILLASNATNSSQTDGAGIEVSGNKTFTYSHAANKWSSNIGLNVVGPTICTDFSATRIHVETNRIAIGNLAGDVIQGTNALAIGHDAGKTIQGTNSIAIGFSTGRDNQGTESIAIGTSSGRISQNKQAIAIGNAAAQSDQSSNAIAIGTFAGSTSQGTKAIAIGSSAGLINQGQYSIAIGANTAMGNQEDYSIAINATGSNFVIDLSHALYIDPIRNADSSYILQYNSTTKEVTYSSNINIDSIIVTDASFANVDISNKLNVTGDTSLNSNVDISENLNVNNKLTVNGDASFNKNLDICGNLDVCGGIVTDDFQSTRFKALTNGKIAIGPNAGIVNQGLYSIAIGTDSGKNSSQYSVSIGNSSGKDDQQMHTIAIGAGAGKTTQEFYSVAVGSSAGEITQGGRSVAIGSLAGRSSLGDYSIALGYSAGFTNTNNTENSIMINATGNSLIADISSALYVKPIRPLLNSNLLQYNTTTGEITYSSKLNITDASFDNVDISDRLIVHNEISANDFISTRIKVYAHDLANAASPVRGSIYLGQETGKTIGQKNIGIGYKAIMTDTSNSVNCIAIGSEAGQTDMRGGSIAIGSSAGKINLGALSVAIGLDAGRNDIGENATLLGAYAGRFAKSNNTTALGYKAAELHTEDNTIAIGYMSSAIDASSGSIAIGTDSGLAGGLNSIAIGTSACGNTSATSGSGTGSIAIGYNAAYDGNLLGDYSIVIGTEARLSAEKSIFLNATGTTTTPTVSNAFFVDPIRNLDGSNILQYNSMTKEITESSNINITDATISNNLSVGNDISVNNNLYVGNDASFNNKLFVANDVSFNNKLFVANDASFNNNLDVSNILMVGQKMGIGSGTNTPAGTLHVSSGTSGDCKLILEADIDNNNENDNPMIIFKQDGGSEQAAIYKSSNSLHIANSVSNTGHIIFETGTSSGYTNASEVMRIADTGFVGIGITTPTSKLHVVGDISFDGDLDITDKLTVDGDASFNKNLDVSNLLIVGQNVGIGSLDSTLNTYPDSNYNIHLDATGSSKHGIRVSTKNTDTEILRFDDQSAGVFGGALRFKSGVGNHNNFAITMDNQTDPNIDAIVIRQDGNVGIKSTDPSSTLFVTGDSSLNGAVDVSGVLKFGNSATQNALPTDRGNSGQFLKTDGSGTLIWASPGATTWSLSGDKIYYNTDNVGIGTVDPNSKLEVVGDVSLNANVDISENLKVGGLITGTLDTSAQPNITSVGTLTELNVSGSVDISNKLSVLGDISLQGWVDISHARVGALPGLPDWAGIKNKNVAANSAYAIIQNANGKTVIGSSSAEPIEFRSQGSLKAIINDSNFGIGVSPPTSKLHVGGDVSINQNLDVAGNIKGTIATPAQPNITSVGTLDDLTLAGNLNGPATFIIDPAGHGDNTGLVIIKGGLQIDGSSTIINSSVLDISDHTILLASNATNTSQTYGAGIEVSGNKTFTYQSGDIWESNIDMSAQGITTTTLNIANAYTLPNNATAAAAGHVLKFPSSGKILEWGSIDADLSWAATNALIDANTTNISNLTDVSNALIQYAIAADMSWAATNALIDANTTNISNNLISINNLIDVSNALTQYAIAADMSWAWYNANIWLLTVQASGNSQHISKLIDVSNALTQYAIAADMSWAETNALIDNITSSLDLPSTPGIVEDSKLVLVDNNSDISGFRRLSTSGFIAADKGGNTASFFGAAAIGFTGSANQASFAHIDHNTITNYSLKQTSAGRTIINSAAGQSIQFRIANSDEIRITSSGNLGIGLNNTNYKLEVAGGDISLGNTTYTTKIETTDLSCSNAITANTITATGDITTDANLGVGTRSAQEKLHVSGAGTQRIEVENTDAGFAFIKFTQDGTSKGIGINSADDLIFYDYQATRESMILNNNNQLRLGSNLTVDDNSGAQLNIDPDTNTHNRGAIKVIGNNNEVEVLRVQSMAVDSYGHSLVYHGEGTGINNSLVFYTDNQTQGRKSRIALSILQDGNIGIGLDNQTSKLEVAGDISSSGFVSAGKATDTVSFLGRAAIGYDTHHANWASFAHIDSNTETGYALLQNNNGKTLINAETGQSIHMRIANVTGAIMTTDKNFGIGLDNPTEKLEVIGDISSSGAISAAKNKNTASYFGHAAIGHNGNTNDTFATFAHVNNNTTTDYSIKQTSAGKTIINSKTGVDGIQFRIGNVDQMRLDGGGNLGIGLTNHTSKLEVVGDISCSGDVKVTGHVDYKNYIIKLTNTIQFQPNGGTIDTSPGNYGILNGTGIGVTTNMIVMNEWDDAATGNNTPGVANTFNVNWVPTTYLSSKRYIYFPVTGVYRISCNIHMFVNNTHQRTAPSARILSTIDGTARWLGPPCCTGYIRNHSGHETSSLNFENIVNITTAGSFPNGDFIEIYFAREGLASNNVLVGPGCAEIILERISSSP